MEYGNIVPAVFRNRPNRFIAEVEIDGHKETVHVKNTGRADELMIDDNDVYVVGLFHDLEDYVPKVLE